MRSAILSALLLLSAQSVFAERDALIEYDDTWNMFSKFEASASQIDGESAILGGVTVGGLLNDQIGIGIAGHTLVNSVDLESSTYDSIESTDFWYGGAYLEYVFNPTKIIYTSLDVLVGGGSLEVKDTFGGKDESSVFVIEPGVNVMINVTETFNVGLGLSYRLVENADLADLDSSDVSGLSGNLFLRFTQF